MPFCSRAPLHSTEHRCGHPLPPLRPRPGLLKGKRAGENSAGLKVICLLGELGPALVAATGRRGSNPARGASRSAVIPPARSYGPRGPRSLAPAGSPRRRPARQGFPGHPQPLPLSPPPRGSPPSASSRPAPSALRGANFPPSPWRSGGEASRAAGGGGGAGGGAGGRGAGAPAPQEGPAASRLSPGPPAARGSPGPPGPAAAPASWLSSPAARLGAHSLAGTSDSGTVTWQRTHVTGARRSPNWRKGRRRRRGGGRERQGGEAELPRRLPPPAPADPPSPHSPRPRHPKSESLGDHTRLTGKLAERRAAGERHLTALQRPLAAPEEPARILPQSAPPARRRRGSARQVGPPGAALWHLPSNRNAGGSTAPHLRGRGCPALGPLSPCAPRTPAKTWQAECVPPSPRWLPRCH